jgi:hypothetical protein
MPERRQGYVLALVAGFLGLATILGLNLLARPSIFSPRARPSSHQPVRLSHVRLPGSQQLQTYSDLYSSSNVLELPAASLDFVGHWGGFTRNTGVPTGHNSGHVAVVFGRRADKVFFESELYSPVGQHILHRPRARMVGSREIVIEYESEDDDINYTYSHRFRLLNSGKIAYKETVYLYERHEHHLLGIAEQRALLKRLTTIDEWRSFSRAGPGEVREGEISASRQLAPLPADR